MIIQKFRPLHMDLLMWSFKNSDPFITMWGCVHMCACMYVCIYMWMCFRERESTCDLFFTRDVNVLMCPLHTVSPHHKHVYICVHVCVYIYVCVCVNICVYVCR